jgi:citrate lyase subunit beta/citryl-CoA lyase
LTGPVSRSGSIETIADECVAAKQSGAGGKLCIHPSQTPAVLRAFLPSADELAWARRVTEVDQGGAAQMVDGKMIDAPIVMRARKLLDQAARFKS